jgi:hypothetical protein
MKTVVANRKWNLFIAIAAVTGMIASIFWILVYTGADRFKIFIRFLWVIFFGIFAIIHSCKYLQDKKK